MADFTVEGSRELDEFLRELENLQRSFPRHARRLMLRSGAQARKIFVQKARQLTKKKTGNYIRSIKRGKVWVDMRSGEYKVRVYSRAPHAHLIEYGHRIVGRDGQEHGYVHGRYVFDKAAKEVNSQWNSILEKEFDKITEKL